MWISKKAWSDLLGAVIQRYERELTELKAQIEQHRVRHMEAVRLHLSLRERLIEAEAAKRAAQATRDVLVVQNAQLQEERGQFLQKILTPEFAPKIRVPQIQSQPSVAAPGVDFEDMGDAAAVQQGLADHIPVARDGEHILEREEDITGLVGQVYDPASELGVELPRLGDSPMEPPEM